MDELKELKDEIHKIYDKWCDIYHTAETASFKEYAYAFSEGVYRCLFQVESMIEAEKRKLEKDSPKEE